MGVKNLPQIAERLIAAGRRADEPAAVVERGTLPGQRTVTAHAGRHRRAGGRGGHPRRRRSPWSAPRPPSAERWPGSSAAPLHGRRVAVTRARAQASGLAARLRALGAEVVETPAIRIEPRPVDGEVARMAAEIGEYALVCLTSPNGATLLFDALAATAETPAPWRGPPLPRSARAPPRELERHGIRADVVPPRSVAESLVEALADVPVEGKRVLVARAAEARDVLPDALARARRRGRRRGAVRDRGRAARRRSARGPGRRATT